MILGSILILLGILPAAGNWFSLFSESLTGKYSSMVPPIGGVLIAAGVYVVTGSIGWTALACLSDPCLIFFPLFIFGIIRDWLSEAAWNQVTELESFRDGHRITLKLFKNSSARFGYSDGGSLYGFGGKWRHLGNNEKPDHEPYSESYEIYDYIGNRTLQLIPAGDHLKSTEFVEDRSIRSEIELNGLSFQYTKATR